MTIKGKTVILTGARRIGQTVAEELAKKGANLALPYRNSQIEAEETAKACTRIGVKTILFQADFSKPDDIDRMVDAVMEEFGRIDVLVHMAAPYPSTPWAKLTIDQWDEINNTIARGAFWVGKRVGDVLLKNPPDENNIKGKIIYFSDWSVNIRPYKDFSIYNSAKGEVESLTRAFAVELAPSVTVNCIAPGPILKPPNLSNKENQEVLSKTPLGRWGGAKPIASGVLFLLDNDFVTGVILPIDGGRTIG